MKRLIALSIAAAILVGCSVTNPGETVISYLRAHNSHNPEMALALIADSIHYEIVGEWTMDGIEEMRKMEQWDAAMNGTLDGSGYQVKGDTVWFNMVERTDWLEAAGIGPLEYKNVRAIAKEGKITDFKITRDPAIGKQMGKTFSDIISWAKNNAHEDEVNQLMPDGEFVWTAETAPVFINLTKQWQEAVANEATDE